MIDVTAFDVVRELRFEVGIAHLIREWVGKVLKRVEVVKIRSLNPPAIAQGKSVVVIGRIRDVSRGKQIRIPVFRIPAHRLGYTSGMGVFIPQPQLGTPFVIPMDAR